MTRLFCAAVATGLAALLVPACADPARIEAETLPKIRLDPAFPALKFDRPLFLTHVPNGSDRLVVLEQGGKAYLFPNRPGVKEGDRKLFLDLSRKTIPYVEMGLLGMAFHPKFRENGFVYVYYSEKPPQARVMIREHLSIVSRFRIDPEDPDRLDPASEKVLMRIDQPYANHNGGCVLFGPDGFLYIGLGDGGAGGDPHGHGQNRKTLLGSMLRIDVDREAPGKAYAVPPDNPFAGSDKGYREEIWAWGLRNPWRFSFDRQTGDLWAGDNGQNRVEEIDLVEKGKNYGWNRFEGTHPYERRGGNREGCEPPAAEYLQVEGGRSVIGGYVYRGKASRALAGVYLYGDYVSGNLWGLRYDTKARKALAQAKLAETRLQITSFGEDEAGEVYVVAFNEQQIYRIVAGR